MYITARINDISLNVVNKMIVQSHYDKTRNIFLNNKFFLFYTLHEKTFSYTKITCLNAKINYKFDRICKKIMKSVCGLRTGCVNPRSTLYIPASV